jgi:hypothetical protein
MKRDGLPFSKIVAALTLATLCSGFLPAAQQSVNPAKFEDLSPNAEQVAESTGMLPLFAQLKGLLAKPSVNPWQVLYTRQHLLEAVMSASLQVDATTARIDSEIAQANEFRSSLEAKRDHKENRINMASIATGGALGVVSSALQLSAKHAKAGNSVGIGAGVIVTVLSVMSLRAQNGRVGQFPFRSNMLAKLFDRPTDSTDAYSASVLDFLNAVPAVDPDKLTRKQRLIRTWAQVGRLGGVNTPEGEGKIARLTGTYSENAKLSISDLEDREAMLGDLRAKLSLMKRDLAVFLASLPQESPTQAVTP